VSDTGGVEDPLWRGVDVFRALTLLYAAVVVVQHLGDYARPGLGLAGLAVMAVWTASFAWRRDRARRAPVLVADLVVALAVTALTLAVDTPERIAAGAPTLPTAWAAAPVLGWAVWRGARGGVAAAVCLAAVDVAVSGRLGGNTLHNNVLLLLLGGIVGYSADLFRSGHAALRQALALEAATAERERLARDIHDSVLQVLAFVQRRAREIGGESAELGRLAGEQEHRLRALVSLGSRADGIDDRDDAVVDLLALLSDVDGARTTVVAPADPVRLAARPARELAAAVRAALDNVGRHAGDGAHAWVLVDDEGEYVTVTVRDDGLGFAPGRLLEAQAAGRLGVAQSVRGRVTDLGGTATVVSTPGEGTEVTLRVPRKVHA
jgi:signal transduction histidine kinase